MGDGHWRRHPPGLARGQHLSESVWGHPTAQGFVGTGGGKSTVFPEPAWQDGPTVPHDGARNTPDVAKNANPYTGMRLYVGGRWILGGDSATGPQRAALAALADQVAAKSLGFLDPSLYAIGRSPDPIAHFPTSSTAAMGITTPRPARTSRPGADRPMPTNWCGSSPLARAGPSRPGVHRTPEGGPGATRRLCAAPRPKFSV